MDTAPKSPGSSTDQPAEDRLAALERRVAELESRTSSAGSAPDRSAPAPHFSAGGEDDTFWALNGLVERLGTEGGVLYTGHVTPPGADAAVSWQMGRTASALGETDFVRAAPALSAFSHPVRLELLQAIHAGATTVAELSADDRFGTSGQIYHHLKALAAAGWLENVRRGHWTIPAQKIVPLLTLILIGTE